MNNHSMTVTITTSQKKKHTPTLNAKFAILPHTLGWETIV
jgi:hypothetical protein